MNLILDLMGKAIQQNLEIVTLYSIIVVFLYVINIVLGTIIGSQKDQFDLKKFIFGIAKMIGISICVIGFCYVINLFALASEMTLEIKVDAKAISVIDVIGIVYIWAYDMIIEVFEKIKSFKGLKYLSYDDIKIQQNQQPEEGIG